MNINYLLLGAIILLFFLIINKYKLSLSDNTDMSPILYSKDNSIVIKLHTKETFVTGVIDKDDVTVQTNIESYNSNGTNYRGNQNKTINGHVCQKWTSQFPHKHFETPEDNKNKGLGDHNYCRNPDNDSSIWCYTNNPNIKKEYCKPLNNDKLMISKDDIGKTWTLDYDKLSEVIKNSCHNLKDCNKINGEIICKKNGKDFKVNDEIYTKCTTTDLVSIINNEWKTIPNRKILLLDITKPEDFKVLVNNLQKWVNNANKTQLKVWKSIFIDQFKIKLKTRNTIAYKSHSHTKLNELIEHLKLLDLTTYNRVKSNIGYSEEKIKDIKDKLVDINTKRQRNKTHHDETGIRIKLILQIINAILKNYKQIFYDKNTTFYDTDKCRDIHQPDTINLQDNNIYDLSKINGSCPDNYYLSGTRFEQGWQYKTSNKQVHQINTCCPLKRKEKNCKLVNGEVIGKSEIGDTSNILDNIVKIKPVLCPPYKYAKSINYKVGLSGLLDNTDVAIRCGSKYNKYLKFSNSTMSLGSIDGSPSADEIFNISKVGNDENNTYYSIKHIKEDKYIVINREVNGNHLVDINDTKCNTDGTINTAGFCHLFQFKKSPIRSDYYEIYSYSKSLDNNPKYLYWSDTKINPNKVYNGIDNVYDNKFETGFKQWWSVNVISTYSRIIVSGAWMREGLDNTESCEIKLEIIDNTKTSSNILYDKLYLPKAPNKYGDLYFEIDIPKVDKYGAKLETNNKQLKLSYSLGVDTNKLIIRNTTVTCEHRDYKIATYRKSDAGILGLRQTGFEFMLEGLDKDLRQEVLCCDGGMNEGSIEEKDGKLERTPCKVIDQPISNGFLKIYFISLNKVDGRCPENSYLKSLQFIKEGDELKQRITCCDTNLPDMSEINRDETISTNDNEAIGTYKKYSSIQDIQTDYKINTDYPSIAPEPPNLPDETLTVPHFKKRTIDETLPQKLDYELDTPFCHKHHYLENDHRDSIHSDIIEEECFNSDGQPKPNFIKDTNVLELYIGSNNTWLNDNLKMSKSQKLLANLIYYKIKGFSKINVDIESMYKHFNIDIDITNSNHDNNYGEFTSDTKNDVNLFSVNT